MTAKRHAPRACIVLALLSLAVSVGAACRPPAAPSMADPPPGRADTGQQLRELMAAIERDLAARGPLAWLDHFDDGDDFFMASDGAIAFADIEAAREFLLEFAATIVDVQLRWSSLQVTLLSDNVATLGAAYEEVMRDVAGNERRFEGYFTGTAVRTAAGWKLGNLHWSSPRLPETMQ